MEETQKPKKLVLFDFDGTITKSDSMLEFVRFVRGNQAFYMGMLKLSPKIIRHRMGSLSAHELKEAFLSHFFKGETEEFLRNKGERFCKDVIPKIVRERALGQIQIHRSRLHDVWVVSASADVWIGPWLDHMKIPYITSEMEFEDGVFTGRLSRPNCKGQEKVKRIRETIDLDQYARVYAYGDSSGDKEMMEMAHRSYYKPFRKKGTGAPKKL